MKNKSRRVAQRGMVATIVAASVLVCVPRADAQNGTDTAQWLQSIASEIRALKAEVIACRLEMQQQAIPALERELFQIRNDQLRLQAREAALKRQMEQTDDPMPALSAETDTGQIELARTALFSEKSQQLKNEQATVAQREAEVRERLSATREQLQILSQKAGKVLPQSDGTGK